MLIKFLLSSLAHVGKSDLHMKVIHQHTENKIILQIVVRLFFARDHQNFDI